MQKFKTAINKLKLVIGGKSVVDIEMTSVRSVCSIYMAFERLLWVAAGQVCLYLLGLFTSPLSRPDPTARTFSGPPPIIGPTVNWNGLPEEEKMKWTENYVNPFTRKSVQAAMFIAQNRTKTYKRRLFSEDGNQVSVPDYRRKSNDLMINCNSEEPTRDSLLNLPQGHYKMKPKK